MWAPVTRRGRRPNPGGAPSPQPAPPRSMRAATTAGPAGRGVGPVLSRRPLQPAWRGQCVRSVSRSRHSGEAQTEAACSRRTCTCRGTAAARAPCQRPTALLDRILARADPAGRAPPARCHLCADDWPSAPGMS
eukprot:scaffold27867_cov120-Isochrysis_galbana.AAC.6